MFTPYKQSIQQLMQLMRLLYCPPHSIAWPWPFAMCGCMQSLFIARAMSRSIVLSAALLLVQCFSMLRLCTLPHLTDVIN